MPRTRDISRGPDYLSREDQQKLLEAIAVVDPDGRNPSASHPLRERLKAAKVQEDWDTLYDLQERIRKLAHGRGAGDTVILYTPEGVTGPHLLIPHSVWEAVNRLAMRKH